MQRSPRYLAPRYLALRRTVSALVLWLSACAIGGPPAASAAPDAPPADVPAAAGASAVEIDPLDWPTWRGPEQNGISREKGLVTSWDPKKNKNVLWSKPGYGTRSTPICMRGKLYFLARSEPGTTREGEKVVCLDAATGDVLWENKFNVFLSDVPDTRVAWSSVVGDPTTGKVYAMGVCGYFQCLDGDTGETLWKQSLNEEYGLLSTYGGRTNFPIVFEDLVITSAVIIGWGEMAIPAHRFLAFDKHTGEVVWFNGTRLRPDDTTYSTPTLAVINGQATMVFGSGDGAVYAFQPRTGMPIWNYQFSQRGLNVSPIVDGNTVYMGQSEENPDDNTMGALCAIDGTGTGDITASGELWRNKALMCGKASPILVDGRLYAIDDGNLLYVLDPATGKQIARQRLVGTIARASPLYADGYIYACTTSAWHVLQPTEDGVKIVQRLRFPDGEEIYASPIASHGRIYLATTETMYCLGSADAELVDPDPRPALPLEAPVADDETPAHAQVVPVEWLMQPGDERAFRVRLFNARGQFLRETEAEFSVDGGGQIDSMGTFTADDSNEHRAALVTARVGELTGTARIRIVPPLPWKFDFNDTPLVPNMKNVLEGEPPVTWVGIRYRHKIRELDGERVMVKVTTIPKGTRSQGWMGQADGLRDYTIQADVRGAIQDGKLPDMGIVAQRYTLDLMGSHQQLQIRSWTAQLEHRFAVTVPYPWKPNTWYTLKLRAEVDGPKAVLKGKVWPRGETEPAEWTAEGVDEVGNLSGSPGLFGNANDAEIYLDNISVVPNEGS